MDERAQVSVEYLLTVLFAVLLVIAVTVVALQMSSMASKAQLKVIENRNSAVSTLMS